MTLFDIIAPDDLGRGINAFAGAALGASFYVLIKTQPYLVNRSFDPKYNAVYLARFITGVIAGVILATALAPAIPITGTTGALTPGVLAILGGFAAEAVEQILQRLVEVLLTAVRGDASAQTHAKVAAEQSQKNATVLQQLAEAKGMQDPVAMQTALDKAMATLKKSAPT
jgi:hypothetical protein